jgi:hypothetical protein
MNEIGQPGMGKDFEVVRDNVPTIFPSLEVQEVHQIVHSIFTHPLAWKDPLARKSISSGH